MFSEVVYIFRYVYGEVLCIVITGNLCTRVASRYCRPIFVAFYDNLILISSFFQVPVPWFHFVNLFP